MAEPSSHAPHDGILIAVVLGAHGLKGEVKVKNFAAAPDALARYGVLKDEKGCGFTIVSWRVAGEGVIAALEGVNSRIAAEGLKGTRLYVARSALPALEGEEFYHADLIGLAAHDEAGAMLGRVVALHNFGAGDMIEIAGESGASQFLPFTEGSVPVVDVAGGRIVVRPPRGDNS